MTSAYADICKGTVEIPAFSSLLKIKDEGSVASLCQLQFQYEINKDVMSGVGDIAYIPSLTSSGFLLFS